MSLRGDILADKLIYFQNDDTPSPPHSPDSETETNLPDVETLRLEGDTDEEDEEDDNENTYKPMKIVTRKEEEEERMRQNKRPIGVGNHNTGPKSVIEDYKHANKTLREPKNTDADFMQRYKQKRMQFYRETRPRFGNLRMVTNQQFVNEVETAHPLTTVVVHLFQNHVPECVDFNLHQLPSLAAKYPYLQVIASRADSELLDEIALPAILCYRGGDLTANLIRAHKMCEDVGGTLETMLLSEGVIQKQDQDDSDTEPNSSIINTVIGVNDRDNWEETELDMDDEEWD